MKKSLVCVLMVLCTLNLFSSPKGDLVRKWNLCKVKTEEVPGGKPKFVSGPLFMNWEAEPNTALSILQVKGIPGMMRPMAGGMLVKQLKDITFQKDGNIVVTYSVPSQDTAASAAPTWETSKPGTATYKVKGEQIHIFPSMEKIMSFIPADSLKTNPELGKAIEILKKGIPVNYTITDGGATLYVDKVFIEKITPFIMAYVGKIENTAMGNMGGFIKGAFQSFPTALQKTTKLEIGLNLEK